jgi:predicted nucleotidyltransferase
MTTQELRLPIKLDELQALLRKHGVVKADIFGSYARGEAKATSDLDLLVELAPGKTYLDLGGLQYELEQLVPGGVDIATKLNSHFEPYIRPELISIL